MDSSAPTGVQSRALVRQDYDRCATTVSSDLGTVRCAKVRSWHTRDMLRVVEDGHFRSCPKLCQKFNGDFQVITLSH